MGVGLPACVITFHLSTFSFKSLVSEDGGAHDGYPESDTQEPSANDQPPVKRKIAYAKPPQKLQEDSDNIPAETLSPVHISRPHRPEPQLVKGEHGDFISSNISL